MKRIFPSLVASMSLLVASCSSLFGGGDEAMGFYVLTPIAAEGAVQPLGFREPAVAVATVRLPDYLNQKSIVTRSASNQLNIALNNQWGGNLDDNITNVLVENLSLQIPSNMMFGYPIAAATPIAYTVRVEIGSFEREANGTVRLVARWAISGASGEAVATRGRTTYNVANVPMNYDAISAAMSQTLAELSRDIAAAIRSLARVAADLDRRGAALERSERSAPPPFPQSPTRDKTRNKVTS